MDIVTILSTIATVVVAVGTATYWLGSRLTEVKKDIEALRSEMRGGFSRLANAIGSVGEAIVGYLGIKGVLDPNEARFLRAVIKNLAATVTATNPLTEAERKRLLELVNKDDLTNSTHSPENSTGSISTRTQKLPSEALRY